MTGTAAGHKERLRQARSNAHDKNSYQTGQDISSAQYSSQQDLIGQEQDMRVDQERTGEIPRIELDRSSDQARKRAVTRTRQGVVTRRVVGHKK